MRQSTSGGAIGLSLALYATAQLLAVGRVPRGFCNDAAEEALRGLTLLAGRRSEVIAFTTGNSAETLVLYLTGGVVRLQRGR